MGPIVLPESFQRRRSRRGSNEGVGNGDLPTISLMASDDKSGPSSPKNEHRRLSIQKSNDSFKDFPSLISDRAWSSSSTFSREQLSPSSSSSSGEIDDQISVAEKQSLFRDLCQTQLSLWTFAFSTLLTYVWQKRVRVRSLLFAFCALSLTSFVSMVLFFVVSAAHLFNSDFAGSFGGHFGDWLGDEENKYPQLVRRQSSSFSSKSGRGGGSGAATPRGTGHPSDKLQQTRFWQKNVSLERSYIGGSSSRS